MRCFAFVIFHHSKSTECLDFHLQGQSVPYAAPPRLLLRRAGPRYSGCCPPPPSPSPRVASSLLHRLRRQCSRRRRSASPRPQVATRQVGSSDRPQNDVPVISLPKPAAPPGSWLPLCAAARPRPSPVPSLSLGRGTAGATCRSRAAELVQLSGRCKRALTRSIGKLWRRRRIWGAVMAVSVAVTAAVLGLRIVGPCAQWISSPLLVYVVL